MDRRELLAQFHADENGHLSIGTAVKIPSGSVKIEVDGLVPKIEQPQLFVLPPSHYCERARWALDHVDVVYREERWAVGLHVPRARRLAKRTTLRSSELAKA